MSNDRFLITSILSTTKETIAPELTESQYFEYFCSSEILKDFDLSHEEILAGIIGSSLDGGIDSIYLLLNGELVREDSEIDAISRKKNNEISMHIIQAKKTSGFEEEAINKFCASIEELFDFSRELTEFYKVYNLDVLKAVKAFRTLYEKLAATFPNISFNFYYATLGAEVHPNVRRKKEQLKSVVQSHFHDVQYDFRFVGARDLLQLARRSPTLNFELEFIENPISTENGSYVCLVPLLSYYRFIVDEKNNMIKRIFDANVRDYQGSIKVNRAIQDTLQNPKKEDFWFLNNGVTIISPKATARGKKILIEDPQVVNGLQTSYEIYNHFKDLKYNPNETRKLLVRVIVEEDAGSRDNIVKATNSQTQIPETSLRAADKIQRDIEDYLYHHNYYYERRKNFHKNAGKPISKIISISYLSQAVISVLLQKPDSARARPSTLINKDDDYVQIFNDKYPIQFYLKIIEMMKRVEGFLKSPSAYDLHIIDNKDFNNIRFHLAMLVAMKLVNKKDRIRVEDFEKINVLQLTDELLTESASQVSAIFFRLGGSDQVAKGPKIVSFIKDGFPAFDDPIFKPLGGENPYSLLDEDFDLPF